MKNLLPVTRCLAFPDAVMVLGLLTFPIVEVAGQVPSPAGTPNPFSGATPVPPTGSVTSPVMVGPSTEKVEMRRLDLEQERETLAGQKAEFATDVATLRAKLAAASMTAATAESMPPDLGIYSSFLSAEAGDLKRSEEYYELLKATLNALVANSPYQKGNANWSDPKLAEANLEKLLQFPEDDDVSRTIKAQISAVRGRAFTQDERSATIDLELNSVEKNLKTTQWNLRQSMGVSALTGKPRASEADLQMFERDIANLEKRKAELEAEKMLLSKAVSSIPMKLQFQQLIVELAFQQRYMHSLIACGFYRLYSADMQIPQEAYAAHRGSEAKDGDGKEDQAGPSGGVPRQPAAPAGPTFDPVPTVPSMEAVLLGRVRDAMADRKSIDAKFKLGQFSGAETLLRKMLATGKYQPELHTIPTEDRQKLQIFGQRMKCLGDALASYDYAAIRELSLEIQATCEDVSFTDVRAFASKHPAKALHWARQARLAQKAGEMESMSAFMGAAMERAPLDADVKKLIQEIQDSVVNDQDLADDLTDIINAKPPRYREAYERRDEFSRLQQTANTELKAKFHALLDMEKEVQSTLEKCDAFAKRSGFPDAWVALSSVDSALAEDSRIVGRKSETVARCPDFVRAFGEGVEREKAGDPALALAWYLTALSESPSSPELITKVEELSRRLVNE